MSPTIDTECCAVNGAEGQRLAATAMLSLQRSSEVVIDRAWPRFST